MDLLGYLVVVVLLVVTAPVWIGMILGLVAAVLVGVLTIFYTTVLLSLTALAATQVVAVSVAEWWRRRRLIAALHTF